MNINVLANVIKEISGIEFEVKESNITDSVAIQQLQDKNTIFINLDNINSIGLTQEELLAVFAHEIGHLRLGHLNKSSYSFFFVFLISLVALFMHQYVLFLFLFIVNTIFFIVDNIKSHSLEYAADLEAVYLLNSSKNLVSALTKISQWHYKNFTKSYILRNSIDFFYPHPAYRKRVLRAVNTGVM